MIAIKKGSSSWRATETLAADEVEFKGEFLYESDGFTAAMVWDAQLGNVRAKTQADYDADAVAAKEKLAQDSKELPAQEDAQGVLRRATILTNAEFLGIDPAVYEAKLNQHIDAEAAK